MSAIPDYFEAPMERGGMALGDFGTARWKRTESHVAVTMHAPKLRVYDVWAEVDGDWMQLQCEGQNRWVGPALQQVTIDRLRLWVGPSWDVTLEPALPRVRQPSRPPPPASAPTYVPVVEGEPPLPSERSVLPPRIRDWIALRQADVVVTAFLDAWTEACARAAGEGWMVGLPRGEDLLATYGRLSPHSREHDLGFARWLVAELGKRTRVGLESRRDAELRLPATLRLHEALAGLVRAVDDGLECRVRPPSVLRSIDRHQWLIDEGLAERLGNPVRVAGAHRPMFVLRPLLVRGTVVVLEGEVV